MDFFKKKGIRETKEKNKKMPSECETACIVERVRPVGNYTLQVSCTSIYKPLIVLSLAACLLACCTMFHTTSGYTCTRVELKHVITTGLDDDDLLLLTYTISCYLFLGSPKYRFSIAVFFLYSFCAVVVVVVKL